MVHRNRFALPFVVISMALGVAACGSAAEPDEPEPAPQQEPPATQSPLEAPPAGEVETEIPPTVAQEDAAEVAARPAWHSFPLTDVQSGESFTIEALSGKVIILETMAVWCPLCEEQQRQIQNSLAQLGEEVVTISLDVDPTETAEILAAHANAQGFAWRFALAGPELASVLQAEFGPQILAPPSTPVLIIGPQGETQLTPFGIKSAADLVGYVEPLLP